MTAADRRARQLRASTGPPRERGGEQPTAASASRDRRASTGPPRERGGETLRACDATAARCAGFNGAAARTRRRGRSATLRAGATQRLQRGRRANAAERTRCESHCEPLAAGFNGAAARTRRRGRIRRSCGSGCTLAGFNGAAARTRRRAALHARATPAQRASTGPPRERGGERRTPARSWQPRCVLQRGRRANAAESSRAAASASGRVRLQRGRRANAAESESTRQHRQRCRSFNGAAARTRRRVP